ncbi:MAG: TonB-dependent receptor, partial [Cytophagaceae bacterium]
GDQVSLGYYHNFRNNTIETSVEGYYKKLRNFVDYTSGAVLLLNQHLETDLVNAEGRAYGVEVSIRKASGKINGWLNYTYSRSLVRVNTGLPSEQINGGAWYPSNFDKPHDVSLVGNYRFSRRWCSPQSCAAFCSSPPPTFRWYYYESCGSSPSSPGRPPGAARSRRSASRCRPATRWPCC